MTTGKSRAEMVAKVVEVFTGWTELDAKFMAEKIVDRLSGHDSKKVEGDENHITVDGVRYEAKEIPEGGDCSGCAFHKTRCPDMIKDLCNGDSRKDKKYVIWQRSEPEKPVCANCIHHATDDTRCLTCQGEYFRAKEKPVTRKEAVEISKKVMDDAESARIANDTPVCPRCNGLLKVPVEGTDDFADCPICQTEIEELEITSNNENEFEMVTKINELVRECKSLRQSVNEINRQGGGEGK